MKMIFCTERATCDKSEHIIILLSDHFVVHKHLDTDLKVHGPISQNGVSYSHYVKDFGFKFQSNQSNHLDT